MPLPAFLYDKLGVNRRQLRAILTTKLTLDNRRQYSLSPEHWNSSATSVMMATQLFIGLVMLFAFAVGDDIVTKLAFFMTLFSEMMCFVLITDFTSVLVNTRDNLIILPKPVSGSTFVTSRLLHIAIRIFFIALPLAAPSCIAAAIIQGPLIIPPFILMILLMTLLDIFIVNAVYLLILKITTPAKFQSIIGYIQIIFTIILIASSQIMPRILLHMWLYHPFWHFVFSGNCRSAKRLRRGASGKTGFYF